MITRLALFLAAVLALALAPAPVLAHDPPPGENSLLERTLHEIFHLVPAWLTAVIWAVAVLLLLGLYIAWRRYRFIVFVDRAE